MCEKTRFSEIQTSLSQKEVTFVRIELPVFFVDLISEAYSVDDSEFEAHVTLLELIGIRFERDSWLVVLGGLALELGVEQCVHESGLPQTRLAWTSQEK